MVERPSPNRALWDLVSKMLMIYPTVMIPQFFRDQFRVSLRPLLESSEGSEQRRSRRNGSTSSVQGLPATFESLVLCTKGPVVRHKSSEKRTTLAKCSYGKNF